MMDRKLGSNAYYFLAVFMWVIAWWWIGLVDGEPAGTAVGMLFAFMGWAYAIGGIGTAVPRPSPFTSGIGRIAWALRPRPWVLWWAGIILTVQILGAPMVLWNYGGGRCQYIDWHFDAHWRPAHGDGPFAGCRAFVGR